MGALLGEEEGACEGDKLGRKRRTRPGRLREREEVEVIGWQTGWKIEREMEFLGV